ncbi:MAG: cysteine synthase CysM [Arenicella sp.]
MNQYDTVETTVGNTPLVKVQRLFESKNPNSNVIVLGKLEGNNPAGSVKDRPALNMIIEAEKRGDIKKGDTLIEATSGNTGIALAMAAAMRGFKMVLIMPDNLSEERRLSMSAYGAEVILASAEKGGMLLARDMADEMVAAGKGVMLDQFSNDDNWRAHYKSTGPELWAGTNGEITHFVSSMGTTGTIMGTSTYLKEQSNEVTIVGVQPADGAQIPGIRRWPEEYLPKIFDATKVDLTRDVSQEKAEETMRQLAIQEGICAGVSSGGAMAVALELAEELDEAGKTATIVSIVCDRGDRYLSTGVYK